MKSLSVPKRYEVRALLGEGGSGRVYRVQDSIRDRELALKLVTPAESAFLRREFDTLRQIRHENLIQVFDWGALPSGEAYYTMELIEGGDWAQRMGMPQPAEEVRRVLTGLLRGLAHLHCHGEIHGDLKPGNILLGAGGVVKITDAGMGGSEGRAAGLSGTPGYTAPEVWEGSPADTRSDLYSVGVMAYEALTGKHPFAGRIVREVISGQLEGWVPSPGAHGVRVPADLERVVMRALERQPGLRQGSADEFMEGFGVEDRIGEILGGKLVGREKEIAEIEKLLYSEEPGKPTLLYFTGEPGIGKSALVEEVADRLTRAGGRSLDLRGTSHEVSVQIESSLGIQSGSMSGSGDVASAIIEMSKEIPLLLWCDPNPESAHEVRELLSQIGRYSWALSLEHAKSPRALIVMTLGNDGVVPRSFEAVIALQPLSEGAMSEQFQGLLGRSNLEFQFIQRLHALTGGNPGALVAGAISLKATRILDRQSGAWRFRQADRIQSISIVDDRSRWSLIWGELPSTERELLATLALLPSGLRKEHRHALGALIPRLTSAGWIRDRGGSFTLASEGMRQLVLSRTSQRELSRIASLLLAQGDGLLDRESRAGLTLKYLPAPDLQEGLWAAGEAIKRSDFQTASIRFKACLDEAVRSRQQGPARIASLELAGALHHLGRDAEARDALRDERLGAWKDAEQHLLARREYTLGVALKTLGDVDAAREHLSRAVEYSECQGDTTTWLRSHADLAEIDWTHGDEKARSAAVERIVAVIRSKRAIGAEMVNDRAALAYALGSVLIRSGRRDEAKGVLLEASESNCSQYWQMRIANAFSTACFYLGDLESASTLIAKAWTSAEMAGTDQLKPRILLNRAGILYALGRIKEAADQDRLAAHWARRIGALTEYVGARAGLSINLILLARYEEAIRDAIEVQHVAEQTGDLRHIAKGLELEALSRYYIGDRKGALDLVQRAIEKIEDFGYIDVAPRLDWLLARLLRDRGRQEALLRKAEGALEAIGDREDLWGVKIEMHMFRATVENALGEVEKIIALMAEASRANFLGVEVSGAVAVAEVLGTTGIQIPDRIRDLLVTSLGRAEDAGLLEAVWRLSYWLAEDAIQAGDAKRAHARYKHALRVLNEIADDLTPLNRKSYLGVPHVNSALSRISAAFG